MARTWRAIERARALGRLGMFTACVSLVLAAGAARSVYGDSREASLIVGRQFAALGGLVKQGHRVRLNGEQMHVGSTTVSLPTDEVLDRFETLCAQGSQGIDEVLKDPKLALEATTLDHFKLAGMSRSGVLRQEKAGEGTVACLVRKPGDVAGFTGWMQRVSTFSQSLDLGDLGHFRYVYTRPTEDRRRSQVITVWTEGSLRLGQLFADGVDAPGTDGVTVPRPPSSVRLLSAEVDGVPYGVRLYESQAPAPEILRFYEGKLEADGWTNLETVVRSGESARAFERGGSQVLVFAEPTGAGPTSVSLIELPAP